MKYRERKTLGRRLKEFNFPKQEEVIYCFKIIENPDSIELVRYAIPEYYGYHLNRDIIDYKFEGRLIDARSFVESFRNDKLDRVSNKKFYTFNPDKKRAEEAFTEYFKSHYIDAATKMNSAEQQYKLWREHYGG